MSPRACHAPVVSALLLAACGSPAGPAPMADAGSDATADAPPPGCVALRGAAGLLPAFGRNTAPEQAIHMVPDPGRDGVTLAPRVHPGAFEEDRPLPHGAQDGDGFYHDGWLYLLGGQVERLTGVPDLLAARIEPDGTLADWRQGTRFRFGIIDHIVLVHAGRSYLTGGAESLGNDSFRQQTAAWVGTPRDGDVAWTAAPENPVRRFGHEAVMTLGYLYTLAGDDGFNATDDVSFAPLLPDGSLGPWRRTTPTPEGVLQFLAGAATSRRVYLVGGCRRKDCQRTVNIEARIFAADIAPDGSLSPWRLAGRLPRANFDGKVVLAGGRIIVTGGRPGGNGARCFDVGGENFDDVWWADMLPDGSFGPWEGGAAEGHRMPRPRSDHVARLDDRGRLWIWGGRTSCLPGERRNYNNDYPTSVWRADMVPDTGFARAGSWLSGPLSPQPGPARTVRWTGSGEALRVRVRTFAGNAWGPWSEPTTMREITLPSSAPTVQVLVEAEGDGTSSPVLQGVTVCR